MLDESNVVSNCHFHYGFLSFLFVCFSLIQKTRDRKMDRVYQHLLNTAFSESVQNSETKSVN